MAMTTAGTSHRFALTQSPWTDDEYAALSTEAILPTEPANKKLCVLVLSQDATRPPRYHIVQKDRPQDLETYLKPNEKLMYGYVVQESYSEWNPFSVIGGGQLLSSWEDLVKFPDSQGEGTKPAVWIVKKDLKFKKVLEIYTDRYQRWGYALMISSKWTPAQKMECARRAFGDRYTFEWQIGNSAATTLIVTNPDAAWKVPLHSEFLSDPDVVEYAKYRDYEMTLYHTISYAKAIQQERYLYGMYSGADIVQGLEYVDVRTTWENLSLFLSASDDSPSEESKTYFQSFTLITGFCDHNGTRITMHPSWLSLHAGDFLQNRQTFDKLVDIRRVEWQALSQHVKPYNIKLLRYNRLLVVLSQLERALPFTQATFPGLETAMPGVTLRPEQKDVLAEIMRRESDVDMTFENRLFVPIATSMDGMTDLHYSPILEKCGVRPSSEVSRASGGVIIADLGWGKTVVTFALIAATSPRGLTLVVVPTKVMMSQWKTMCDSMTTLKSYMYGKTLNDEPADLPPDVDVIFTTYAILKKDSWLQDVEWSRVVYDEVHELQRQAATWNVYTDATWGLTATIASMENPSVNNVASSILGVMHPVRNERVYGEAFLRLFAIKAPPSSKPPSWTVAEATSNVIAPARVRQTYENLQSELLAKEWPLTDKMAVMRLHKVAAGFSKVNVPRRLRLGDLMMEEGTSDGRKRKVPDHLFEETECPICMDPPTQPVAVQCGHMFCKACISTWLTHNTRRCPICRAPCGNVMAVEDVRTHLENPVEPADSPVAPRDDTLDEFRVDAAMDLINAVDSTEKIVVFSHYNDILKCLGRRLRSIGIEHVDASASRHAQALAHNLSSFETVPDCRVMLLNTRTQSAGLNVTAANHVIFVEQPMESTWYTQGVGRVARDGQTRNVSVTTVVSDLDP